MPTSFSLAEKHGAPQSSLCFHLLGLPTIIWNNSELIIPRRSVRGLLYRLACSAEPVARTELCFLFYPDFPEEHARRNLTRLLTHMRRALPRSDIILAREDRIGLTSTFYWCDVVEFRKLSRPEQPQDRLMRAAGLYTGPFLTGIELPGSPEFENWLAQERTELENQYLSVLSRLIEISINAQDYRFAINCAERYLQIDPLAEGIQRQLICLYVICGDRSRALRQYETCMAVLETELGARPLPETQAVYQAVVEGKSPKLIPDHVEFVYPTSLKSLRLDIPIVGRAPELAHINWLQQLVRSGKTRFVLISGEAGVGKSRILYEITQRSRMQYQVLFAAAQPGEKPIPYYPIVEALRSAPLAVPVSLPASWLAEITRLLPELRDQYSHIPAPFKLQGEEARLRLFDALCHYLFALHDEQGPLLMCFDDLHWFDQTSLTWLIHLSRQLPLKNHQVMLIGTYRTEEVESVQVFRDNLARLGILDETKLTGLDSASLVELFQFMFENNPGSESLALRLQDVTNGNPFFILEILQALGEEGTLPTNLDDPGAIPLPDSIRAAVSRRIRRLSPGCRQVLEAGAVLSSPFSFKVLQQTAGRSELETALCLETLTERQLFQAEVDRYRFRHDLIRRVTLTTINPVRLRILHARAGKVMEKSEPDSVAILAGHFDAGGVPQKALHYYDLSVKRAEALFAWQETEAHLSRMLVLHEAVGLSENGETTRKRQAQILAKLIEVHSHQGKLAERDEDFRRLEGLARSSIDVALHLQAIELRVKQLNNDACYSDAITAAESGLALLRNRPGSAIHGRFHSQIGLAYLMLGQPSKALEALEEAQACTTRNTDLELRIGVLSQLGLVHRLVGDYHKALEYYQDSFSIRQTPDDPYSITRYVEIGYVQTNLCQFVEAKEFLDECLIMARKAGLRTYEGHALLALGGWHLYQGDPVAAIQTLQCALEILAVLRSQNLTASTKTSIGFAYYHLCDLEVGQRWLEAGLELSHKIGHQFRVALANIQLGVLETAMDRFASARIRLEAGLQIAQAVQSKELTSSGLAASARLERLAGSPVRAKELAVEALSSQRDLSLPAYELWANFEIGLALADLGEIKAALACTAEAVSLIPRAHQLWLDFEQVYLAHAVVLGLSGDMIAAEEMERRARAIYRMKAARIIDPAQRQRFRVAFEKRLAASLNALPRAK